MSHKGGYGSHGQLDLKLRDLIPFRSKVSKQIGHWAKIGEMMEDNPDLHYEFVKQANWNLTILANITQILQTVSFKRLVKSFIPIKKQELDSTINKSMSIVARNQLSH